MPFTSVRMCSQSNGLSTYLMCFTYLFSTHVICTVSFCSLSLWSSRGPGVRGNFKAGHLDSFYVHVFSTIKREFLIKGLSRPLDGGVLAIQ